MFGRDRVGVFARRNSAPVVMLGQVKIFLFAFFSCLVNVWLFVCVCVLCDRGVCKYVFCVISAMFSF